MKMIYFPSVRSGDQHLMEAALQESFPRHQPFAMAMEGRSTATGNKQEKNPDQTSGVVSGSLWDRSQSERSRSVEGWVSPETLLCAEGPGPRE